MEDTSKFIQCECHGHGLMMDHFIGEDGRPSELYIIVYGSQSYFEKPDLWYRIKRAWGVLRTGKVPGGEAVLSETNAANLVAYINNFLIKSEP